MASKWQGWIKTTWALPVCQWGCFQVAIGVKSSAAAYTEADASVWCEENGASSPEIVPMAGFHSSVHGWLSLAPAWCFHRTLHLLLTRIVFSNLETFSNHCFGLKKEHVCIDPKLLINTQGKKDKVRTKDKWALHGQFVYETGTKTLATAIQISGTFQDSLQE